MLRIELSSHNPHSQKFPHQTNFGGVDWTASCIRTVPTVDHSECEKLARNLLKNGGDGGVGTSFKTGCAEPFALVNFLLSAVSFILEYYRRNIEICRSKFLRRLVERYQRGRFLALLELAHSPLGCQAPVLTDGPPLGSLRSSPFSVSA